MKKFCRLKKVVKMMKEFYYLNEKKKKKERIWNLRMIIVQRKSGFFFIFCERVDLNGRMRIKVQDLIEKLVQKKRLVNMRIIFDEMFYFVRQQCFFYKSQIMWTGRIVKLVDF